MSTVRRRAVLASLACVVATGLGPSPAVAGGPVERGTTAWSAVEEQVVCGGAVALVVYDGTITTTALDEAVWVRARTALRWEQDGSVYAGRATAAFLLPPSGRASTYRFQGTAVGTDGTRVHVHEVVHAVWSDGVPELRVELERVDCR